MASKKRTTHDSMGKPTSFFIKVFLIFCLVAILCGMVEEIATSLNQQKIFESIGAVLAVLVLLILLAVALITVSKIYKRSKILVFRDGRREPIQKVREQLLQLRSHFLCERLRQFYLYKKVTDTPEFGELYLKAVVLLTKGYVYEVKTLKRVLQINRAQTKELITKLKYGHVIKEIKQGVITSISYSDFCEYMRNTYIVYDNRTITPAVIKEHYGNRIGGRSTIYASATQFNSIFDNQKQNLLITLSDRVIDEALVNHAFFTRACVQPVLFIVLPESAGTYHIYNNYAGDTIDIVSCKDEIQSLFEYLVQEIHWREQNYAKQHVSTMPDFNHPRKDTNMEKVIALILCGKDNLQSYEFMDAFSIVINKGPMVGVQTIISTYQSKDQLSDIINITSIPITTASQVEGILTKHNIDQKDKLLSIRSIEEKKSSVSNIKIEEIDHMDGFQFEHFCKELLSTNGFKEIRVTSASKDYGADIVAMKDDIRYVIQCKRYSGNVGEDSVREVYSSKKVYDAEIAVVLTNSHFTNAACILAKHNHVHLWDREQLVKMISD